ncbi:bifunctional D-cysteine desulfhydrase/1-aminocyclopropane-1-carboxylate deaminase, mitochondrial-like [Pecten maximus]|uniref:bifunctional D-cysteine desulfhydrase/1-aminocyclopropane-1-carboxylate deaminase, mitochondrial-like n=1 Tax=Pecten maximus TaxID=6579 RepID=UPI00145847DC|nr:bifunctional D-cysteine desulfhydrase/1-aminocyclopropane-1-carboxylate deaminase, mitochondrial-like [Pecten maximus]
MGISNYLTGSRIRCHAIIVCDQTKAYFYDHIDQTRVDMGLADSVKAVEIVDMIEGYQGKGYNISTKEERDFVASVAETTGIMLDPIYTGKAALGMLQELHDNPHRFKGNRILFLHTGGLFGMYNGQLNTTIADREQKNIINMWTSTESTCTD